MKVYRRKKKDKSLVEPFIGLTVSNKYYSSPNMIKKANNKFVRRIPRLSFSSNVTSQEQCKL